MNVHGAATQEALEAHVERFNACVRNGSFEALAASFVPDGVMSFEGVPVGPFHGRAAIGDAYRERPPDDTLSLMGPIRHDGSWSWAGYAWDRRPTVRAGEIRLRATDEGIAELVVTFDAQGSAS
jgi:hypothetical protein